MSLTLALLSLPVTLYFGIRLHDVVYRRAMDAARVDIGRELTVARSYLSRESEAAIALEVAAQFLRNGEHIDGPKLQRYLRRVKKIREWA